MSDYRIWLELDREAYDAQGGVAVEKGPTEARCPVCDGFGYLSFRGIACRTCNGLGTVAI